MAALLMVGIFKAAAPPPPLSEEAMRRYDTSLRAGVQPSWDRRAGSSTKLHVLLQSATQLHQSGELDQAVGELKKVLRDDSSNLEAYSALAKVLNDQGKFDLADRAMAKARKLGHDAALKPPW